MPSNTRIKAPLVPDALPEVVLEARSAMQRAVDNEVSRRAQQLHSVANVLPKTRKSQATRERIMTAASELMVEQGNTDFQMSEISARCHMSKGALYYYFADKDALVCAIFDRESAELLDSIESIVAESPSAREALISLCAEFGRRMRRKSPLALTMTREMARVGTGFSTQTGDRLGRVIKIVAAQVERAKAEGLVRDDINALVAGAYITGGFLITSLFSASTNMLGDVENVTNSLFALTLCGVGMSEQDLQVNKTDNKE